MLYCIEATKGFDNVLVRGGRVTKRKGAIVSFAPLMVCLIGLTTTVYFTPAKAQAVNVTGSSSTTTQPESPTWNAGSNTYIGVSGTGGLVAENGQVIDGTNFVFGVSAGDIGTGSLTGTGTTLNSNGALTVGDAGAGTLNLMNGANVTNNWNKGGTNPLSYSVTVGSQIGSYGILNLTGPNTKLTVSGTGPYSGIGVGLFGKGEMHVEDGAVVETERLRIGFGAESDGFVAVRGTGSRITVTNPNQWLVVGVNGQGRLLVEQNGAVNVAGYMRIGEGAFPTISSSMGGVAEVLSGGSVHVNKFTDLAYFSNTNASLLVDGAGSSFNSDGIVTVGRQGKGTLSVSNSGVLNANSGIVLASNAIGNGTLNVGTGGKAGTINTPTIMGGAGTGTVNFNHIDDIDFSPRMTGSLAVNHRGTGTTTLLNSNDYIGVTTVDRGTLQSGGANVFSPSSEHVVNAGGTLNLNGYDQRILSLNNGGNVRFGGAAGTTLTVSGNYVGSGGTIYFNTALGDDSSETDRLVITGDTSGSTNVKVTNIGGAGAQTNDGIKLINVTGTSNGTFTLIGDYSLNSQQVVVGGAYGYGLYKNGVTNTNDGNWYLRSQLSDHDPDPADPQPEPLYQAGVPTYEAYPQALLGLNGINTLQQRVGNRFWASAGNHMISEGADAVVPYAPPEEAGVLVNGNGVWGRIEGSNNYIEPRFSTSATDLNQNLFKMQAGIDGLLTETEAGSLIGGVFVQYVHGKTKTQSFYGDGEIATDGYGFGGTLTWYGKEGFYIDGQAHATWYNSDLNSSLAHRSLTNGNHGVGYALSIETGRRVALDPEWSVTPQAQLVYSSVDFDDFTDIFGAPVSLDKSDSLQGRFGATLDHENSWQNFKGLTNRSHVYAITNVYYEFFDGTRVDVAGLSFASKKDPLWGGVGVGGSYNWDNDKYSIYGEGIVNTSLNNFGDSYSVKGNVGFRLKW